MGTPIDAEALYASGALRPATVGRVNLLKREGRLAMDLSREVARPISRLADNLRRMGEAAEADLILRHAVHDGVEPTFLVVAVRDETKATDLPPPPEDSLEVASGVLRGGLPPVATDLASCIELANYLRGRVT